LGQKDRLNRWIGWLSPQLSSDLDPQRRRPRESDCSWKQLLVEELDRHNVAFVAVTQQINTFSSMGRLMLNVLLSLVQFEREIISERTRDKIAASRRKGIWSGGMPLLGYDVVEQKLVVNADEAARVRTIFDLYLEHKSLLPAVAELERREWRSKIWTTKNGTARGGLVINKTMLHAMLTNVTYVIYILQPTWCSL
jgi:site-specific DNA recombinase